MTEDPIVQQVRAVREAFAAAHGYDIRAMVATLREQTAASGREVVRLETTTSGGSGEPQPSSIQPIKAGRRAAL